MPPRWLGGIIILFWLAATGWLFWHDLWPRWLPGEPPPFHIDDVEEVQKNDTPLPTEWIVERQNQKETKPFPVFHASTWVDYHKEEDEYTLNARLEAQRDPKFQPVSVAKIFKIHRITSAYRVNRSGQLRSLNATVEVRCNLAASPVRELFLEQPAPKQDSPAVVHISLRIWGEVHDRQFFAHCCAEGGALSKPMQFDLPAAPVSYTGSVLMPLHPVSHIRGLRLGQSWRQPLVDPLNDALASLPGFSGGVRWLNARVLSQSEMLNVDGIETKCLVIEYTNDEDEMMGRTWVEQDGERVLQQEAILEDGRWIMKRELKQKKRSRFPDPRP